ncbi:sorting nexin-18 isoform 3-T3 [Vipera latastei]
MALLRARALYDFRSENPGEISLREHEVLSLCSDQEIEGWFEGVNSRGDRGLFPASYVQVIRAPAAEPALPLPAPVPARYANVPSGGFEPLTAPATAFNPPPVQPHQLPPPAAEPFQLPPPPASSGFSSFQTVRSYGGSSYQASQGSDDDWDDDWDDSSTVADEPGVLGCSYPDYENAAMGGGGAGGSASRYSLSTRSDLSLSSRSSQPGGPLHHPAGGAKSSATVSRNLNRFSTFVKSGGEAFVLGEASGFVKDGDKLCVVLGSYGPEWQENPYPFQCSIEDPTKQTKFKGMKSYIAYKLVPSHTGQQVHRRYKHFDWLYGRLVEKFPVISVPHLPEKQATGRFEEDFISKRRKGLAWWMDHMCSHPVLAQCDAFQHFLTCPSTDEKAWKQGKRKAEKDEMVGANFFLTISVPAGGPAALDLQEVESKVDGFKSFTKKMDESTIQLNQTIRALTKVKESKRHVEEGKMEIQKADGIQDRCNIISFATLAEIHHFHRIRVRDFKSQMQHFLQQQILFFQKVTQKLEEALHKYDSV